MFRSTLPVPAPMSVAPQPVQPIPPLQPPADDHVFALDAGRACLDFVNTRSSSGEHLNTYADLAAFAAQANLVAAEDAAWLRAEAEADTTTAQGVLVRALRLREAMRRLFSAIAAGKSPREADLGALNFDLAASLSHARVQHAPGDDEDAGFVWGWSGRNLDAPIWPITRSAADLLTSDPDRRLVRECSATDCAWFFLDATKNRSRQWCSMQACGNREKARRHYQRLRARRTADEPAAQVGDALRAPGRGRRRPAAPVDDATATAG